MIQTVKNHLIFLAFAAVLFGICALLVLLFTDPSQASNLIFAVLYFSLAAFFVSIFTILFFFLRGKNMQLQTVKLAHSLREAFLLAILIIGLLVLASKQLAYWWLEALFIVTIVIIEIYFLL